MVNVRPGPRGAARPAGPHRSTEPPGCGGGGAASCERAAGAPLKQIDDDRFLRSRCPGWRLGDSDHRCPSSALGSLWPVPPDRPHQIGDSFNVCLPFRPFVWMTFFFIIIIFFLNLFIYFGFVCFSLSACDGVCPVSGPSCCGAVVWFGAPGSAPRTAAQMKPLMSSDPPLLQRLSPVTPTTATCDATAAYLVFWQKINK